MSGNKLVDLSMEFAVEVLKIWIKTKLSHCGSFFLQFFMISAILNLRHNFNNIHKYYKCVFFCFLVKMHALFSHTCS